MRVRVGRLLFFWPWLAPAERLVLSVVVEQEPERRTSTSRAGADPHAKSSTKYSSTTRQERPFRQARLYAASRPVATPLTTAFSTEGMRASTWIAYSTQVVPPRAARRTSPR